MPSVEFEPTIPEFERSKTVHAHERYIIMKITRRNILEHRSVGSNYIRPRTRHCHQLDMHPRKAR
jgi:hypothetical protein